MTLAFDKVARLAKLVCWDFDASIEEFVSVDRWATVVYVRRTRARRLGEGNEDLEDRNRHLLEIVLDLNKHQLEKLANNHQNDHAVDRSVEECAPNYSMGCLFDKVRTGFRDFQ